MARQLPAECLNEILEYLEDDKLTLHSCLLVNRLWCKISVRIMWRDIWNFKRFYQQRPLRVATSILSTLIACLSNESKELLNRNEIFILTPTSKSPLFNYAAFCKVLSINEINRIVKNVLRNIPADINSLNDKNNLIANEVIKMFTSQISSLKKLTYYHNRFYHLNISFPYFPGARDLSELCCASNLPTNFFYQLSQICHNLQSIFIEFHNNDVSNELKELISLQNNLKTLALSAFDGSWANIIPTITKHSHTITKLQLYGDNEELPLSFVRLFSNLQEFIFSFYDGTGFEDFKMLQYVHFSKLQVLKIPYQCPRPQYIMKFLENNGKNLKKYYTDENDNALSLSVAKFCPNLKSLFVIFSNGEIDILKKIFISCQYLESIKIWCGEKFLTEKEVLETVASHSPNNFCELRIYNSSNSNISSEDLESFFINWKNRASEKLLSLVIIEDYYANLLTDYENMDIIEKYENLGIVKLTTIGYEKEKIDDDLDYYY
ncbi:hypothetical protein RhiirA5_503999 [Rhizophagus irregularis]|uniref:F-box domain-containing protein n=1 Tax=Rhizophagus irregularis TaxID=588596 RepID=A0A2I1F0I1_9GLOM|nr:hypothetical protein RhiirA5_503999 [Rhizophagus irregularis]PKC72243.1 hypothetical protein RhiirA1_452558 [Rhizophagus irregularis]PKY27872.1 hypothetical protein RhiirB3_443762 [Rhizophagus irregularis]